MPLTRIVRCLSLLVCALPMSVIAQSAALSSAACTYQTCALRVEPVFLGTALVKGGSGEQVARLSGFGGGVALLLSGPDSAAAHASRYVSSTKTATVLGLAAVTTYVLLITRTDRFQGHADNTDVALALGSAGLSIATIPFTLRAQRELSRAVWWYNAALAQR